MPTLPRPMPITTERFPELSFRNRQRRFSIVPMPITTASSREQSRMQ